MSQDQPVLIVGRGIAGLSAAFALGLRGISVAVIGPDQPSSAATHAAVGLSSLKGQHHAQKPLFAAKVEGHLALWSWLTEVESVSGLPIPRCRSLGYEPYWTVTEYERIRERVFHRSFAGHTGAETVPTLPPAVEQRFVDRPRGSAVYDSEIWYDPRSCMRALEAAILRAGGRVFDDIVTRIETSGSRLCAIGQGERYESPHLILAAGVHCDQVLEASGIKGPKQKAVFGETLVFDNLPHSSPQIIHMEKKHLVAFGQQVLFGSSSVSLNDSSGYVGEGHNPALDLDPRLRGIDFNNSFSTRLQGIRGRYSDIAPCVGLLNLPKSEAKLMLFSGFYKSGLQLAPLFAAKLASYYAGCSAFFCDSQFSVDRFSSAL